jgi:hypothetical protein
MNERGEKGWGDHEQKIESRLLICSINLFMKRHRQTPTEICHEDHEKANSMLKIIHYRSQVVLALLFKQTAIS